MDQLKKKEMSKETVQCTECTKNYVISTSNPHRFTTIDIEHQVVSILSDENILENLLDNYRSLRGEIDQKKDADISDIHDAELYQKHELINSRSESDVILTVNINSDGAAVFNNSKYSLWPITLLINELPLHLRFKMLLLGGAMYTNYEPNFKLMDLFMKIFFQQFSKLITTGIKISRSTGEILKIFLVPLCISVDSVARPAISGRMKFNSYDGCHWCDIHVEHAAKSMRYPVIKTKFSNRTHEQFIKYAKESEKNNCIVKGIRGHSSICKMFPFFDCIWGYPIEYMHGVLLGVVRQLWDEWTNTRCKFYLKPKAKLEIDDRLTKITPTKEIYRLPSVLKKKGKWKAAEWLFWLLFYSIPCLWGILDDEAFASYVLLVKSINVLLSKEISVVKLENCEKDIKKFVRDCQNMYGIHFMTFNVHSLLHLCDSVRRSGPLFATSAFPFESKIGNLKTLISGPKGVTDQLCDRFEESVTFMFNLLKMENEKCSSIFCANVTSHYLNIINYNRSIENAIIPVDENQLEKNVFNRCIFRKTVFHSTSYTRPKRTNNTIVRLSNGRIAKIVHFFFVNEACFARVRYINVNQVQVGKVKLQHILAVTDELIDETDVSISDIQRKLIVVKISNEYTFICIPPCIMDVK